MKKIRSKILLHPIMSFLILILITIVLSGIFGLVGLSTNYNTVNAIRGGYDSTPVAVKSLLNLSGLKLIFRTTVSNFAAFAPLSMLLITLIGIGIMDRSGFLSSFFTLLTKKASKKRVTFVLSLITILASIMGDISFIVLIPITALFFKYSKRNPKAGIILAFAGLTCGTGINIFMNSIDSSLLEYTRLAAGSLDVNYTISNHAYIIIMLFMTILMSFVITNIAERITIPRLGKYEEEIEEEQYLDKYKKRGLLFSFVVGSIYLLIFIYNIIPGLPLSGNLLDYSQKLYIDKLFGYNSFFNQGFVFVITIFFFLCGLFYGLGAKTIKNNRELCNYLGHSLDGIGKPLVLIFFASTFISIFKDTSMGSVITALIADLISSLNFTGIPLIITTYFLVIITTIFVPSAVSAWSILSGVIVPVFMNAGLSAEFAELIFRGASCVSYGLTPLMAYFVIYLAFLDMYSEEDRPISLFGSIKEILPYSLVTGGIWLVIFIVAYILGLPLGIGTFAVL